MANVSHATLTGADLHEPKGAASASSGQVYVANGAGSGAWALPTVAGSWTLISTGTASASSALNFTGFASATYRDYIFVADDILPATNGAILTMRTSTNGGSSYDNGASDYAYMYDVTNMGGGSGISADDEHTAINLSRGISNTANHGFCGTLTFLYPASTGFARVSWVGTYVYSTSVGWERITGAGIRRTTGDVDAVRFLMSTGNIASGNIKMYGLKL